MRIEDSSLQPFKGREIGRADSTGSGRTVRSAIASMRPDEVSLSNLAALVGGTPGPRLDSLHDSVAAGDYRVPADQISQRILDYYLRN